MLSTIRRVCVKVSGDELLSGCCAKVALIVQAAMGGELVQGTVGDEPHFWNRLPGGREVDLTSSQFGGDGLHSVVIGTTVEKPDPAPLEHLAFAARVLAVLEQELTRTTEGTHAMPEQKPRRKAVR